MNAADMVLSGSLYKIVETVERLEEITPLTVGQLQRTMQIGYGRASAYMDLLEELGIVSRAEGREGRRVLLIRGRRAVVILMRCLCDAIDAAFEEENRAPEKDVCWVISPEEESRMLLAETVSLLAPLAESDDVAFTDTDDEDTFMLLLPTDPAVHLRRAVEYTCTQTRVGISQLQRALYHGYGRAAKLIDQMEELGIVGPDPGDKTGHEVLLTLEEALARLPAEETVIVSPSYTRARVDPPVLSPSEMLRKAVEVACSRERIGTSALQRNVRIGYGKAVALIDQMEELGIVGPDPGDKTGREVLLSLEEALARLPAEDTVIVSPSHTQARVDPPVLSPSEMLRKAVEVACSRERIGTSALQRSMNLGYGRAAALIDQMEELGIIGPDPGDKTGRKVLLSLEEALARLPAEEN